MRTQASQDPAKKQRPKRVASAWNRNSNDIETHQRIDETPKNQQDRGGNTNDAKEYNARHWPVPFVAHSWHIAARTIIDCWSGWDGQ